MSIVCAAIKGGIASISCDTQSNMGSTKIPAKYKKRSTKLLEINHSVIGVVGWSAIAIAIEHLAKTEQKMFKLNNRMEIYGTLLNVQKLLIKNYYIETKENDDQPVDSIQLDAIVINKNGIFEVGSYREVEQFKYFWAIGSGQRYALGAMHAVYSTAKTATEISDAGVKAAAEFDDGCGMPLKSKTIRLA